MFGSLPPFDYHRASSLDEALGLLQRYGGDVSVFAGGTDLLGAMMTRKAKPRALVDIKPIPELNMIQPDNGALRLGGAVTARAIARSPIVRQRFPLLSQAMRSLGSMQIGNRATVGGNLSSASPAADSAPALLALQASVKLVGPKGERWVPLGDFFTAPGKTVLDCEILTEIRIPPAPARGRGFFYKLGARAAPQDYGIVNVALFALADGSGGSWEEVRIALGAAAPTPLRAARAEASLRGQAIEAKAMEEAARLAAEKDARPFTDIRGSAEYRRAMVRLLVRRALEQLAVEVKKGAAR